MDKPLSSNASTSENLSGKGAEATPKVSTTPHPNHTRATAMLGSIVGDIVGSIYEFANIKTKDFEFFQPEMERTDDSILCIATADWLLHGGEVSHYYSRYALEYPYPMGGYGGMFKAWSSKVARQGIHEPYNSCGNGSAMRIAPVGWAFETEREVLAAAEVSASCTHNHPEGIKGAQATALCIFLARQGHTASDIRARIERDFGYDLSMSVKELQRRYSWQGIDGQGDGGICQDSVPQAIICVLQAKDFEDAIRNAISIGGDSDTIGCIAGGIAEALYGIPEPIKEQAWTYLDETEGRTVRSFIQKYSI